MNSQRIRRLAGLTMAATVMGGAATLGAAPAIAASDWTTLTASGTGEEEIPDGSGEAGATVVASIQLNPAGDLTYTVTAAGNSEEISAAHIHEGAAGVNGDVVVDFDPAVINAGGTATVEVDPAIAQAILDDPAGYYVNVHSASFAPPSGVARGQLTASAEAPDTIQTGTGGQAADDVDGTVALAAAGAVVMLAAAGVVVARRRAGTLGR